MRKLIVGLAGLGLSCAGFAATPANALRDYSDAVGAQERAVSFGSEVTDQVQKERGFEGSGTPSLVLGGAPANDECVNAQAIPCDSTVQFDNTNATTAANDPDLSCYAGNCPGAGMCMGANSVWFSFVAASNGMATVNSCPELPGGGVDTVIAIYDGTCGNLTEIACNEDGPAAECPIFNAIVVATGLTPGNTYIIEVVSFTPSDVGLYEMDLICDPTGACCLDDTCSDNMSSGDCFDAGGIWQGTDSLCVDVLAAGYCVTAPACPPGSIIDNDGASCGQPAPDNNNAGCASASNAFQNLGGDGCGAVVCGQSSADDRNGSNRDTDWYLFNPLETTEYTACVTAQFFPQVQFWPLNPGIDPCLGVVPSNASTGNPGELVCVTECLLGGNAAAIRVTTVDVNGDPQRAGIGCVDYVLEVTCDECTLGACCESNNSCSENSTEADCINGGGEYQGDDSTCAGIVCGGSCCLPNGMCTGGVSRINCLSQGGAYNGQGSLCVDQDCPVCSFEDPNDLDGLEGPNEDCSILGVDLVNSGCTGGAAGTDFSLINCDETICGITAFDGGTRDLDWYHFSTPASETEVLIELDNQMSLGNPILFRFQWRMTQVGVPACDGGFNVVPSAASNALPPGKTFFSQVLTPGRYTVLVAYDFANNTALPPDCPDGGRYRLTITCNDACTFTCTSTEGEPNCGDPTQLNDGCSVDPVGNFSPMSLNSKVCGTTRLVQIPDGMGGVTATRDIDWWMINIPSTGDYSVNLQAEFESLVFLQPLDGPMGCDDDAIFAFQIFQCNAVELEVTDLPAGNYAIFVAADFNSYTWFLTPPAQETCGSAYTLEVVGSGVDPCAGTVCADSNCDGFVTVSDIGFFVTAVAQGEAAWNAAFPGGSAPCDFTCANDTNGDGFVTVSDIGLFVAAVTGGGCQ